MTRPPVTPSTVSHRGLFGARCRWIGPVRNVGRAKKISRWWRF